MLNDLESNVDPGELSVMSEEVAGLSDKSLHETLTTRLGLSKDASGHDLDVALAFVEEPEVLSEAGTRDPGSTPDLSHGDNAGDDAGDDTRGG